ncbi:hypothetical protein OUZ56_002980 [Daphnia magna]|uniref:Uncharacterized protein n=1 Tax=Daphnia magna TaxID=35525 RepID=A0ABR0A7F1_9CRUS|nr:hypothetical protein OUZ56_002980 [Daphnia magna]
MGYCLGGGAIMREDKAHHHAKLLWGALLPSRSLQSVPWMAGAFLYSTAGCCGGAQLGAGQPPLNADYSRQGKTKQQQQLGNNLEIVQSNRPPLV